MRWLPERERIVMPNSKLRRVGRLTVVASGLAGLVACASLTPISLPMGTPIDQARHRFFGPSNEYPLRDGATRLEYLQGKQTFMLDFDASGKLVASQQVLDEAHFAEIKPGMAEADVRTRLGRPVQVYGVGWQQLQHVWSYRYWGGDCVWFQVSISDATRRVTEAGNGSDPACDAKGGREP
jgi:hypothetical protein